jgi:pimeloyl-ACP methyl ester carboxylesterase
MDSRGHGRSTRNEQPYSYELLASDVLGLMDYLQIQKAAIIGWSDGAIVGLDIAIHNPERLTKLFAFAANSDPSGVKEDVAENPINKALAVRVRKEYAKLSPTPDEYESFRDQIHRMWDTQPNFTAKLLSGIKVPTWIVDGDHHTEIKRENTLFMADQIPNAELLLQPGVGHLSFLQDPEQFNFDALHFLQRVTEQ